MRQQAVWKWGAPGRIQRFATVSQYDPLTVTVDEASVEVCLNNLSLRPRLPDRSLAPAPPPHRTRDPVFPVAVAPDPVGVEVDRTFLMWIRSSLGRICSTGSAKYSPLNSPQPRLHMLLLCFFGCSDGQAPSCEGVLAVVERKGGCSDGSASSGGVLSVVECIGPLLYQLPPPSLFSTSSRRPFL